MDINLEKLEEVTNPTFFPLFMNQDRYLVLWGGAGSGKSYFCAEKTLVRILRGMENDIKHKALILRKTKPAARASVFTLFMEYIDKWGLRPIIKVFYVTMTFRFANGSEIICAGLDDPEKIKSIQGITMIWLEEPTELTIDDFTQIDLRLRGKTPTYKQILFSFNPISETNWIKQRFFDDVAGIETVERTDKIIRKKAILKLGQKRSEIYTTIHHSTYRDNRFIDLEYANILENLINQDQNYYNVYNLGKWGVLRGIIYNNWQIVKAGEWPDSKHYDSFGYGLDFGYSNNPTACLAAGFIGDCCYIREMIYEKALTNPMIVRKLKAFVDPFTVICADSAEPKSIEEIKQGQLNVWPCKKGPDSVVHGIQRVKQFKIFVHEDSVNTIKEFETYKWAEDKDGMQLNKPVDFMNHSMDAMRYIIVHLKGAILATAEFHTGNKPDGVDIHTEDYNLLEDDIIWSDL